MVREPATALPAELRSVSRQMDATNRIVEEFDRLTALGRDGGRTRPLVERIVY